MTPGITTCVAAGPERGHAPQVLRFVHVVQLLAQAVAHLAPDGCEVGVGEQREQRLQQAPQVDEVGLDDAVYPRVLDLHRDRPPVVEDAAVHLPDRGGGNRLRLELLDRVAPAGEFRVELALHHAERDRRRLPLQRGEHAGHFGREQRVLQAQHLADFHRRALQLAELAHDALGVEHEVRELVRLARRSGEHERNQLLHRHRRADAPDQAAQAQQPRQRRARRDAGRGPGWLIRVGAVNHWCFLGRRLESGMLTELIVVAATRLEKRSLFPATGRRPAWQRGPASASNTLCGNSWCNFQRHLSNTDEMEDSLKWNFWMRSSHR